MLDVPALFPTTVIGSLPRPQFLKDVFDDFHAGRASEETRQRLLDDAVPFALALQEAAGVDVISDGEWRRFSYVAVICDIAGGFERGLSSGAQDGKYWHTVVDRVTPMNPGLLAEDATFAKRLSRKPLKVALPSPYLMSLRMWDEARSKKAYATRQEFARALVPILRDEILALKEAGVHTVQIDDPHLCLFVDDHVRAQYQDADAEAMHCVELINACFEGVEGVTTAVHLCRRNKGRKGWVGEGSYEKILGPLRALEVKQLMMEFAIPAAGDPKSLADLPDRMKIGFGCVDCRGEHVPTPEEIVTRVEEALRYVDKSRLVLAPDCGFAPGNAAEIPVDEAYRKLRNMARAAEMLRQKHG
jgi:5-methyltetrahydropteroyltriglutamate--homocysteine methyltransferase